MALRPGGKTELGFVSPVLLRLDKISHVGWKKLLNIKVLFDSRLFLKAYSLFKSFISHETANKQA